MAKKYLDKNVYEAAIERIAQAFEDHDKVLVAFSGGKDSGVMMNLCYDYAKDHGKLDQLAMYSMDYEADFRASDEYVERCFNGYPGMKKYWLCLPISAQCSCSMTETYWIPWDEDKRDIWVKEMPDNEAVINEHNCPFPFKKGTYGKETRINFAKWFANENGRTAVMVGLRADESLNRLATITSQHRKYMFDGLRYTSKVADNCYSYYPIYDWTTEDIWIANARFGWDYNKTYDLMYQAGVPISQQRLASPFHSSGQCDLKLYKVIAPDVWGKMVSRVNGVNFMGLYGGTVATGYKKATKPAHFTWEEYAQFLLNTLPDDIRERFLANITRFENTWSEKGYGRNPNVIAQMEKEGIELEHTGIDDKRCTKPGFYEIVKIKNGIPDETEAGDFRHCPSWKAICITILKNDWTLQYMGVSRSKKDNERKKAALAKYKNL